MIEFKQDTNKNYTHRTEENVRMSDITISFSVDFSTPGERATKNYCDKYKVPFIEFHATSFSDSFDNLFKEIKKLDKPNGIKINIAGNGLFTLVKYKYSQQKMDICVNRAIKGLLDEGVDIKLIRSGGQTGADEAGIKAAIDLGIDAVCLAPKGWRFRNDDGKDVWDEQKFKDRFII